MEGDVCTVRDIDLNPPQVPALLWLHLELVAPLDPRLSGH